MPIETSKGASTAFVLIHGVGDPADQELLFASHLSFQRLGIPIQNLYEFNWNLAVFHPFESAPNSETIGTWMNDVYIARIGSSILNAAVYPFALGRTKWQRALTMLCERLALIFQTLPIAVVLVPLCLLIPAHAFLRGILTTYLAIFALQGLLGLMTGRMQATVECLRTVLIPCIWSIAFVFLLPGNISLGAVTGIAVFGLVLLVTGHLPDSLQPWRAHFEGMVEITSWHWLSILYWMAGIAVWGVVTAALAYLVRSTLYLVTKILADVSLYLGDEKYRQMLIGDLDSLLNSIAEKHTSVVLVSHSLGTVIAADTLRQFAPNRFEEIVFVTSGSPMARMFGRFFPAAYPPPKALHQQFCSRYPRFRWVNVFRPLDPIGASLGLPKGCDISTRQWSKTFLSAHGNYWSDPVPYDLVVSWLERTQPLGASDPCDQDRSEVNAYYEVASVIRKVSLAVAITAAVGLPVFAVRTFTSKPAVDTDLLLRTSTEVPAVIAYWKTRDETSEHLDESTHLDVRYTTATAVPIHMTESPPEFRNEDQNVAQSFKGTDCWVDGHQALCMNTRVRYAQTDPRVFTLPDFEHAEQDNQAPISKADRIFWIIFGTLFCIVVVPVVIASGIFWVQMLLAPIFFRPLAALFGFVDRFSHRFRDAEKLRDIRATSVSRYSTKPHASADVA
ncbi:lysophospholipase [Granulicella paludicola]|uniref:lysophospholipase n=1 Tax=Granulicella paludicola TaxID=474951 RepID=UPI0021DFCEAE|nr:lysophospholipase [Granulicella paludicola]